MESISVAMDAVRKNSIFQEVDFLEIQENSEESMSGTVANDGNSVEHNAKVEKLLYVYNALRQQVTAAEGMVLPDAMELKRQEIITEYREERINTSR